ncbi:hypothetical protein [Paraflavitalea sp. CAU 1676]|uniref:hypothetical protein n=1 Tax=Paraflavitalea sp. CAU 1676 TaxID=3032598 RepID=UPI0023D9E634|nr:hypothetical protein [Paraflavitalea sp. CAU 1676]MDF2193275.1 hypothetical protein [Paraflavitalea sp. CAU 1676]
MIIRMPMRNLAMLVVMGGLLFAACSKEKKAAEEPLEPFVAPVGNVYGQQTAATIGVQGGTLATPDGQLQLTIPAGALTANTAISIQPVENTTPGGFGLNYRLLPHGIKFAKPVTVKFSYAQYLDSIPSPDALAIAFQDNDRIWKIPKGYSVDKGNKTVSVQTTHFSDWAVMKFLDLEPAYWVLFTGEQLTLKVVSHVRLDDDLGIAYVEEDLIPVTRIANPIPLRESLIKEWKLVGGGELNPSGNTAVYTAPGELPARNPVAVSVQLKNAATLLLISNIWVLPKKGVWIKIDQEAGLNYSECRLTGSNGVFELEWRADRLGAWQGVAATEGFTGAGTYSWGDRTSFYYEEPLRINDHTLLAHHGETQPVFSTGSLRITRWAAVGEMVSGDFTISNAGRYDANSGGGEFIRTHAVKGYFNVRREE